MDPADTLRPLLRQGSVRLHDQGMRWEYGGNGSDGLWFSSRTQFCPSHCQDGNAMRRRWGYFNCVKYGFLPTGHIRSVLLAEESKDSGGVASIPSCPTTRFFSSEPHCHLNQSGFFRCLHRGILCWVLRLSPSSCCDLPRFLFVPDRLLLLFLLVQCLGRCGPVLVVLEILQVQTCTMLSPHVCSVP